MASEIRKDYLQESYALISPRRGKRPGNEVACPFCPSGLAKQRVIKTYGMPWKVAVVENLYSAFTTQSRTAYGREEVVVETPDHEKRFHELSAAEIAEIIKVYGERIVAIRKDKRIKYILVFKNSGLEAGATKTHEHSQIIGMEFLSPHLKDKTVQEHRYESKTGRCFYCDMLKKEAKGGRRIYSDKNVIAFTPYASQFSYEARIFPRRHIDNAAELTASERSSLAFVLKNILTGVAELKVPFNFYMHERVMDRDQHFYVKIAPRGARWAGFELGTGLIINPVAPEAAVKYYRKSFKH